MKAIILAAGLGRRMRPLTDERHKTLLPIAGTTILRRILDSLRLYGVQDVCIVTGYREHEIREVIAEHYADLRVEFVHNPDYETTNNVYSMALALETIEIDSDILLIESDLIFDPRVLGQLIDAPYPNAALVDRFRPGLDGTVVSVGADRSITQVHPSYLQNDTFDFSDKYKTLNMYRFDQVFCTSTFRRLLSFYSRSIDDNCYYELLLGVLIYMRAAAVHAVFVEHAWAEVDDPNDLASAEFLFNDAKRLELVEQSWGGYWNFPHLDFAFIRNMHFPTPAVVAEIRSHLDQLMFNYGSAQSLLDQKVATFELCDPESIVLLNGASQVFPSLGRLLAGRRVLRPLPSFGEYARVFPDAETYVDDGHIDWREVRRRAADVDVLVVVNPNNPTGTVVRTADIAALAEEYPSLCIIVDESFIDFSDEPSIVREIEARGLANVVVVKSLSKVLGVPGIRLGYVYTRDAALRSAVRADLPVWNVNSIAEHFLEVVLKHRRALADSYEQTRLDRAELMKMLAACGVVERVYPSGANFVLVRLRLDALETRRLVERTMSRHLVHFKDVSAKFADGHGYLRLAVRTPADHERACRVLVSMTEEVGLAR